MAASPSPNMMHSRSPAFDKRVEEVKFDKTLLNEVVMEYLIREGYAQSASDFAREANLEPSLGGDCIEERVAIRRSICAGNIKEAIEMINDLDPELIELIRPALADPETHMMDALQFAEENLAPIAPTNPQHLRDLEETMALLIFQPGKVHASLAHLLEPDLRSDVATRVNEALLENLGIVQRSKLYELVKMREWSENVAREARRDIPAKIDIGLNPPRPEHDDSIMHLDGNGHSDNVTMS